MIFENRTEAAELLSSKLNNYKKIKNLLIIAIPRGGVVLGKIISDHLKAPLDIIVVKKIGAPNNPELAIGAVGPEGITYWDENLLEKIGASKNQSFDRLKTEIKSRKEKERSDLENILRDKKPPIGIKDKAIILVDDGVATGATVKCAINYLKKKNAKKVVLAVPVISEETFRDIEGYFDKIVVLDIEKKFNAVGQFYKEFYQITDEEVINILKSKL